MTGRSPLCVRALDNLQLACEQHPAGRYHIEVVDLIDNPRLAADDQILAVRTLVKKLPPPIRTIVGDLSDTGRLLAALQLRARKAKSTDPYCWRTSGASPAADGLTSMGVAS